MVFPRGGSYDFDYNCNVSWAPNVSLKEEKKRDLYSTEKITSSGKHVHEKYTPKKSMSMK